VGKFGTTSESSGAKTKTLEEFADELSVGESSLAREGSKLLRVVDVVLLKLTREKDKKVLIQASEQPLGGKLSEVKKLPGRKKGSSENDFQVAFSVLERTLKIDPEFVNLNEKKIQIIEEKKDSPSYPGMQTLYRKRIIFGDLRYDP